jgi:hypothetical protein
MIIFTLDPPSKSTSSIAFLPICTYITTISLFIAIVVVLMSGTKNDIAFSFIGLVLIHGLFTFNFCHR